MERRSELGSSLESATVNSAGVWGAQERSSQETKGIVSGGNTRTHEQALTEAGQQTLTRALIKPYGAAVAT